MSEYGEPHYWRMIIQAGDCCEWVCMTHDPPCHKTTFDGSA